MLYLPSVTIPFLPLFKPAFARTSSLTQVPSRLSVIIPSILLLLISTSVLYEAFPILIAFADFVTVQRLFHIPFGDCPHSPGISSVSVPSVSCRASTMIFCLFPNAPVTLLQEQVLLGPKVSVHTILSIQNILFHLQSLWWRWLQKITFIITSSGKSSFRSMSN